VRLFTFLSKKALAEMQKQVADLVDIKKRHQIAQTENAQKIDTEIKGILV
jgi:hypothetical protein